ncbi:RMND1 [Lepeophtheirus salmonis]|uniref:RMND1 n=1 Tax=Lepeophtheirus salmonis TaxID=72036 RepID=A0A7R8CFW5_LEPSM|nr:RMND1 [Lepeophtheirus salmonis]CAF2810234.1 RMND1 [Lepeophtheirus salmonis]
MHHAFSLKYSFFQLTPDRTIWYDLCNAIRVQEKGSVVFWNVPEFERENVLQFLKLVEYDKYEEDVIRSEAEMLKVIPEEPNTKIKGGVVSLSKETDSLNAHLEKYSFSDAISASVKLGVLESSLHKLIGSIEHISDDLKAGRSLNFVEV